MARPIAPALDTNGSPILSYTPDGTPFQYLIDDMKSRGQANSSVEQLHVLVAWKDADDFLAEAVGYTEFTLGYANLNRTLPLAHPFREGFFCDEYDLVATGANPNRVDFNDPNNNNAPVQDWCRYLLSYSRPRFWARTDAQLSAAPFNNQEQQRYTTVTEMPRARLRMISGLGYEYLPPGADPTVARNWQPVPEERQAIPDYQIDVTCVWHQIPIGAVPYGAINTCLNTVNSQPLQLITGGRIWRPGELLLTGLGNPYEVYFGADDSPYYDVSFRWTYQTGTWNKYLARTSAGAPVPCLIRIRGTGLNPDGSPVAPPYISTDHNALFVPSAS